MLRSTLCAAAALLAGCGLVTTVGGRAPGFDPARSRAVAGTPYHDWKGVSWGITFKFVIDGLLYGLATGAVFAWLWPAAA